MAHELARRADGRAAIAFVGDVPWHGLGQPLTKNADLETWRREAGLDWEALEAPVTAGEFGLAKDYKAIVRSDNRKVLAIVGSKYQLVQPGEVLDFFESLIHGAGWYMHTAGVLKEGNRVWAMATNDQVEKVGKGDDVCNNLLLATSMDGSMRTMVTETSIRVVCNNTLSYAVSDSERRRTGMKISHRQAWDPDAVKAIMAMRSDNFKTFIQASQRMAQTGISLADTRVVLHRIFKTDVQPNTSWLGSLADRKASQELSESRGFRSVLALFQGEGRGSALKTSKGTVWGLLNAVTEYVDHYMGNTDDGRLDSAWFGRGAEIKNRARDQLVAYAEAN